MFRHQASALYGLDVGQSDDVGTVRRDVSAAFDRLTQLITGCGQIDHDTDGKTFHVSGRSPDTAGISGDHAILRVDQYNEKAGTATNPFLYSALFSGPVKFLGQVIFDGDAPPEGVIRIATATANWVNNAHPAIPTVAATDDETGDVVTIRLYRTSPAMDPNVRTGYKVPYFLDVDGNPVATGGYSDLQIGRIISWNSTVATIAGGWQLCDGTNGTPDMRDRFQVGAKQDDAGTAKTNITGSLTQTGGSSTHDHGGSTGSAGAVTDTASSHTHTGTTDTGGSHSHGGFTDYATTGISITDHTGNTAYASIGISATDATAVTVTAGPASITFSTAGFTAGGVSAHTGVTADSHGHGSPTHTHNLTEPTNGGAGTGHRHSIGTLTHTITEPNAGSGHRHAITSDSGHTHTFTSASGGSHSHAVSSHSHSVSSVSHLPPYYALCYIQRVS